MSMMFGLFPFLLKVYADSGYQGSKFRQGLQRICRQINVVIVKRFRLREIVVLPRRRGGREDHRLAQPVSPSRQGSGMASTQTASRCASGWSESYARQRNDLG
jgi:hypothetical protein